MDDLVYMTKEKWVSLLDAVREKISYSTPMKADDAITYISGLNVGNIHDCTDLFANDWRKSEYSDIVKLISAPTKYSNMFQNATYTAIDASTLPMPTTVMDASYFAYACKSLQACDLSRWTVMYNCTSIQAMFYGCSALTEVRFPTSNVVKWAKIQNTQSVFNGCTSLTDIDLSHVNLGMIYNAGSMFYGCTNLKNVDMYGSFSNTKYTSYMFANCTSLETVCLRDSAKILPASDANFFNGVPTTTKFFVPSALLDTYKAATNWSTRADQLYALEDYTTDGTTTGTLDADKVAAIA